MVREAGEAAQQVDQQQRGPGGWCTGLEDDAWRRTRCSKVPEHRAGEAAQQADRRQTGLGEWCMEPEDAAQRRAAARPWEMVCGAGESVQWADLCASVLFHEEKGGGGTFPALGSSVSCRNCPPPSSSWQSTHTNQMEWGGPPRGASLLFKMHQHFPPLGGGSES